MHVLEVLAIEELDDGAMLLLHLLDRRTQDVRRWRRRPRALVERA
jgi:hypothetical protein